MDKKEYNKQYREKHKKEYQEYNKKYRKKHKKEYQEYSKKYYLEHKKEIKEKQKQYYIKYKEENIDKIKENNRKSYEKFRSKHNWSEYCSKKRKERVERLKKMGCINAWLVCTKGDEPIYENLERNG